MSFTRNWEVLLLLVFGLVAELMLVACGSTLCSPKIAKALWDRFEFVYTPKHGAMRIISARKANQREVKHYEDSTRDN